MVAKRNILQRDHFPFGRFSDTTLGKIFFRSENVKTVSEKYATLIHAIFLLPDRRAPMKWYMQIQWKCLEKLDCLKVLQTLENITEERTFQQHFETFRWTKRGRPRCPSSPLLVFITSGDSSSSIVRAPLGALNINRRELLRARSR